MEKLESKNSGYEIERKFQLGLCSRKNLFEEYSTHATEMLSGSSCQDEIGNQQVDICICGLSDMDDILLLLRRRSDETCMILQAQMEDFSVFERDWRGWLRFRSGIKGLPLRVSMDRERKTWKDDALKSVSSREDLLQHQMFEWEQQADKASKERQEKEVRLQDIEQRLSARQLALAIAEGLLKTSQSKNEDEAINLNSSRRIVQDMANGVGSISETVTTLADMDALATSITETFFDLQRNYEQKAQLLTESVKFRTGLEAKLVNTNRRLENCGSSLQAMTKKWEAAEEIASDVAAKDTLIQDCQSELAECEERLGKVLEANDTLRAYSACKKRQLAGASRKLEAAQDKEKRSSERCSSLSNDTIPTLETSNQLLGQQVEDQKIKMEDLRERANRCTSEASRLRLLNDHGITVNRQRQIEIDELKKEKDKLREETFRLRETRTDAFLTADKIHEQAKQDKKQNSELRQERETLLKEISRMKDSELAANTQVRDTGNEIVELKSSIARLESESSSKSDKLNHELTNKTREVTELSCQLSDLHIVAAEVSRLREECIGKDNHVKDLDAEIAQLKDDSTDKDSQTKDLEEKLAEAQQKAVADADSYQSDLSSRNGKIDELKVEADDSRRTAAETIDQLTNDLAERDAQIKGLESDFQNSQKSSVDERKELRKQVAERDDRITNLNRESVSTIGHFQKELKISQDDLDSKKDKIRTLGRQMEAMKVDGASQVANLDAANRELNRTRQGWDSDLRELDRLSREIQDLEASSEAKRLAQELETEHVTVCELTEAIQQINGELDDCKVMLTERDNEVVALNETLDDFKRASRSEIANLNSQRDEAIKKRNDKVARAAELRMDLDGARAEVAMLRASQLPMPRLLTGQQALNGLHASPRHHEWDQEDEMLDTQREGSRAGKTSVSRLQVQHDTFRLGGRKRKAAEMSEDEEESESEVDSNNASDTFTIKPSIGGTFTISSEDAKGLRLTSDVVPDDVLDALRTQMKDWSSRSAGWCRPYRSRQRKCVLTRIKKHKSSWDNGENSACSVCQTDVSLCCDSGRRKITVVTSEEFGFESQ